MLAPKANRTELMNEKQIAAVITAITFVLFLMLTFRTGNTSSEYSFDPKTGSSAPTHELRMKDDRHKRLVNQEIARQNLIKRYGYEKGNRIHSKIDW